MAKAIQWTNIEKNKKELDWVGDPYVVPCSSIFIHKYVLSVSSCLVKRCKTFHRMSHSCWWSISCWRNCRHPSHHQVQEQGCRPLLLQKTRETRWHRPARPTGWRREASLPFPQTPQGVAHLKQVEREGHWGVWEMSKACWFQSIFSFHMFWESTASGMVFFQHLSWLLARGDN